MRVSSTDEKGGLVSDAAELIRDLLVVLKGWCPLRRRW